MRRKNKKRLSLLFLILTLPPPQGFISRETNFHLCQFFSNFLKYFSSNFPSSQLYSNFVIYFPSSSLLLYSSILGFFFISLPTSTFSCHLTSVFNLSLNLSTNSFVFSKSFPFSHISFSTVNPFQHTKYLSTSHIFLLFNIFSISHSSTSSTLIGFPSSFFCPFTCSLYCTTQLIFTTCHKLHSACISTTSGLIFTNQVVL